MNTHRLFALVDQQTDRPVCIVLSDDDARSYARSLGLTDGYYMGITVKGVPVIPSHMGRQSYIVVDTFDGPLIHMFTG